jgi:hypothetical protein
MPHLKEIMIIHSWDGNTGALSDKMKDFSFIQETLSPKARNTQSSMSTVEF